MHIVLGGTGHVGAAVARALLEKGQAVTVVTRTAKHAEALAAEGARIAEVDVLDTDALRQVFRRGRRAFLLNPPADPAGDTDRVERQTAQAIVSALTDSGLEKVVIESTQGARPGAHNGDLGVLHEMEQALQAQPIPASIVRAGYYMSNWDMQGGSAREEGIIASFFPADFKLPMVAPDDPGQVAAALLMEAPDQARTVHVEGPERYSALDVAAALARAIDREVKVRVVPRDEWVETFKAFGFSAPAAASYAEMTRLTLEEPLDEGTDTAYGTLTLDDYFAASNLAQPPA